MHRTEGPDYVIESGKRRYKEVAAPGTVVNKFAANALQEEFCVAIESFGITLHASGAADRTAGWGQLYQAMLRSNMADIRGYGAVNNQNSAVAINGAIAAGEKIIYIPQGIFFIEDDITFSPDVMFFGQGPTSILKFVNSSKRFILANNAFFVNMSVDANDYDMDVFKFEFTVAEQIIMLKDVYMRKVQASTNYGIKMWAETSDKGLFIIDGLYTYEDATAGQLKILLHTDTPGTAKYGPRCLIRNIQTLNNNLSIAIQKDGDAPIHIVDSIIDTASGLITIQAGTGKGTLFENCYLDIDEYYFSDCEMAIFRNCILGATNNNLQYPDTPNPSRVIWDNCRKVDGKINGSANIEGIFVKRSRITSAQSVGATSSANIDFNGETAADRAMANHTTYTKDDPWDSGNNRFDVLGYGKGRLKINCSIAVNMDTTTITENEKVDISIMVNGSRVHPFNRQTLLTHATGRLGFEVSTEILVEDGDYVAIEIVNGTSGSISVMTGYDNYDTVITIEGL